MSEIEVKILNIDVEQLRNKFAELGAVLVKKEKQINHIFDFPGDLIYKNYKGFCRLREVESQLDKSKKFILGIKKMKSQDIVREMLEAETQVENLNECMTILTELGLYEHSSHEKIRESYKLNNILFEIDQWKKDYFPTPYLEIEAENIDELKGAVELIGFKMEDTTSKNLKEIRKELGLITNE